MENTNFRSIKDTCKDFIKKSKSKKFVISYSGGVDSSVLLHVFWKIQKSVDFNLRAIHINHNILSDSEKIEDHCRSQCNKYSIDFKSYDIQIDGKSNIEEKCRILRYHKLSQSTDLDEVIITGHQLDDQIETFLMRILRGSSLNGLASIRARVEINHRVIMRPLLNILREEINKYQKEYSLEVIEDISNRDIKFDRNFIRKKIIPVMKDRWKNLDKSISNNISIINVQLSILDDYILKYTKNFYLNDKENELNINNLKLESDKMMILIIHKWVSMFNNTNLNMRQIKEIIKIIYTNNDSNPLFEFNNIKIMKKDKKLMICDK